MKNIENNSGVYALKVYSRNLIYIGSSKQMRIRKNLHFSALRKNDKKRFIEEFLDAFNNNEDIKFEILEICENYLEREQYWIDYYRNSEFKVVNVFDADRKGSLVSDEFKLKMSSIRKDKWKDSNYREKTLEKILKTSFKKGCKGIRSRTTCAKLNTGEIKEFESAKEAALFYDLKSGSVVMSIRRNKFIGEIKFYYK